jgi:hypothetical protein
MPAIDSKRGRPAKRKPKPRPRPVAPPRGDVGTGGGYRRQPPVRRVADPKGVDLPRTRRYEAQRRRAGREARDVKGASDLRRGRRQSAANIREARLRVLRREAERSGVTPGALVRALTAPVRAQSGRPSGRRGGGPGASIDALTLGTPSVAGSLGRLTAGTGSAIVRDPGGVALRTGGGLRDALAGIPSAVVKVAVDTAEGTKRGRPWQGLENLAKDYARDVERRYGGLSEPGGVRRFSERVEREGLAAELLDAAAALSAGGATAGRGLSAAARTGRLGKGARRVAAEPRRRARVSGGESRAQELSPNLFRAAAQKAADERRARGQRRRVERAGDRPLDALVREAVARGEVVPRRVGAKQRRGYQQGKGRERLGMLREQSREIDRGASKQRRRLDRHERQAFKYAMQLGLPADPAAARRLLLRRRDQIVVNREAEGTVIPRALRATNDELAVIDRLLKRPERAFTPKLRETVRGGQARERRVAGTYLGLDPVQAQVRRYLPQAAFLGIERAKGESPAAFLRRVKVAAKREGLTRPGYFPSEKRPSIRYSDRAVGGARAIAAPRRYTGALFRTGREDTRPEAFEQALARGIKRKRNWNLVADTFERNAFEWGRNKPIGQLLDELDRRGIDPATVAFWNPSRYRDARRAQGEEAEHTGRGEEPSVEGLAHAVDEAAVTVEDIARNPEAFRTTRRPRRFDEEGQPTEWADTYSVVSRALYDEIHADTRPSGFAGRAFDVVKGKQARVLLGLSPAWLQFQIASNALLTGFAGTGPGDLVKSQLWWRKLSEAEKAAVEPYVGIGHFQDAVQQTKIGAARTRVEAINRMVDSWRALKQTTFLQRVGRGNPLDLLFRADNAQNNAFRRAVLYPQIKRDAYRRMGENTKAINRLETRLSYMFKLGPEPQMRAILKNKAALERHAQHVNDFLGDYTTYTARERRVLGRPVMFYGFLRHSLRFTFLTMPVKHPVMASIMGQLGRLQVEEVRELLGGDELPWALGKLYFSKDGKLKSIDLARANPALNAITGIRGPKDVVGLLPPLVVSALDQLYSKTSFRDRPFRVEGETQGRKSSEYTAEQRARIVLDQMLGLAAPYRALEKATQTGPQGDDSLLWDARPTRYKRADIVASIAAEEARRPRGTGRRLLQEFLPLVPREDRSPEIAASIRERNAERRGESKRPITVEEAWRRREAALERRNSPAAQDAIEDAWRKREQRLSERR